MPWKKEATVLKLRKEFVTMATREQANMSQLCRRFGISRKTGYKWLGRWDQSSEEGLKNRSQIQKAVFHIKQPYLILNSVKKRLSLRIH